MAEGRCHFSYRYGGVILVMKRGMTSNLELWDWFNLMLTNQSLRADAEVVIFASDGETERARFQLSRCVPVKLKSPPLNAKDGAVAIGKMREDVADNLGVFGGNGQFFEVENPVGDFRARRIQGDIFGAGTVMFEKDVVADGIHEGAEAIALANATIGAE